MRAHGKKYTAAAARRDIAVRYQPKQAIDLVKSAAFAKFDETVELAMRLGVDPKHAEQMVRGALVLPNGIGKTTRVAFGMDDVLHTFKKGHRVMIQVQSSWFPLVDRNPQTFVDIYNAKPGDFKKATQRVYRSGAQASGIELQVLPSAGAQPPVP